MTHNRFLRIYALCAFVIAGCASAAVTQQSEQQPTDPSQPSQIVVYPFAANASDVTLNQSIVQRVYRGATGDNGNADQLKIAHDTADLVCTEVASSLKGNGYNAACVPRGTFVPGENILIVDGLLTNVNEGNRLRRLVIGFGAGSSTLDAKVAMYQRVGGNLNKALEFSTHADSGRMPGAAVMAPVGVAAGGSAVAIGGANAAMGGAKTFASSTSNLAKKTADQIVKAVIDYATQSGWRTQ